jgi:phosphoribosylformylglycinamidine synthase
MSQNKRIFVEKRGIFDVESPKIFDEVKAVVPSIQSVKVYNVYDIFGLNDGEFEKVVNSTFVDPVTDILIEENPAREFISHWNFCLDSTISEQILHNNVLLY